MLKWVSLFLLASLATPRLGAWEHYIVILRHAEKLGKHANVDLSAAGRRRAEALAPELGQFRPISLWVSDRPRSEQTLRPLALRTGLPLATYPFGEEARLAEEVLRVISSGTVIICAHSDTIGPLARALGYPGWIPEVKDHDRLWVLHFGPEGFRFLEQRLQGQTSGTGQLPRRPCPP